MNKIHTINIRYIVICFLILWSVTTFAQIPTGYYDSAAGKTGAELKLALYNIIKGHTEYPYTSSGTDVWDILKETDKDTNNSANVILLYTGWTLNGEAEYDGGVGWSREHVWAKSHGGFGEEPPAGTDAHHLRPADITVNSARNNKDFDNGGTRYSDGDGITDCYTDSDSWEPRDEVKGDVARMMFYMATRYRGEDREPILDLVDQVNTEDLCTELHGYFGKLSTLLEWHEQDPVSNWERNRNDIIYTRFQHNRNPFIDHPEYVAQIWDDNPPPIAPSTFTANNVTQTSVLLSWTDNSSDENGFYIYQDDVNIATLDPDTTSYLVDGLSSGTKYTFNVAAFNGNGVSFSADLSVTTARDSSGQTVNDSLFFSEYIEGSSYNKALEIFNASSRTVYLDDYNIIYNMNAGAWFASNYSFPENAQLNPGEVWVIVYYNADSTLFPVANEVSSSTLVNFNGDDVRALVSINGPDTTFIDVIGLYDRVDPGNGWAVAGVDNATAEHTLVRKPFVKKGNPDWLSSAGTDSLDSEWILYAADTFEYLGFHEIDTTIIYGLCDTKGTIQDFRLYPCYPNPFNPSTTIRYDLEKTTTVILQIFDLRGMIVNTLVNTTQSPGNYEIIWDATNKYRQSVPAGFYLYRLQTTEGNQKTGKMVLLK